MACQLIGTTKSEATTTGWIHRMTLYHDIRPSDQSDFFLDSIGFGVTIGRSSTTSVVPKVKESMKWGAAGVEMEETLANSPRRANVLLLKSRKSAEVYSILAQKATQSRSLFHGHPAADKTLECPGPPCQV